jgi:predicted dehydrogenase
MAESLGIGMIGSGFMGLSYSQCVVAHVEGAHLVSITGGSRAGALAEEHGVPADESVEAMVARPEIDAVIVATPDQCRLEITEKVAAAGKHLLVEKPMAPTVAECDQMIEFCEQAGVSLGVVKTERFRTITRKAKALIDEGAIGPIWMMRTLSAFPISLTREVFAERQWMEDPASGGLFMGMASHNTDFLRWLSGKDVVKVFAQVNTFSDLQSPAQSVMAQLQFEDGVMAQMWTTSELPDPSIPDSEVRFEVIGRDAILDLENFGFLRMGKGDSWEDVFIPEKFDWANDPKNPVRLEPHYRVIQGFVDDLREQRPQAVGGAEGRAAVEICEACLQSAASGQVVELPLSMGRLIADGDDAKR